MKSFSFKVNNFRLFAQAGAQINFRPVTTLTGANSSGKSSYVKALILFSQYLQTLLNDFRRDGSFNPVEHPLDFSGPDLQLRDFQSAYSRFAPVDGLMSFSYSVKPSSSAQEFEVTYAFKASTGVLGEGQLAKIILTQGEMNILEVRADEKGKLQLGYFDCQPLLAQFDGEQGEWKEPEPREGRSYNLILDIILPSVQEALQPAQRAYLEKVLTECLLSAELSHLCRINPFTPVQKLYSFEDKGNFAQAITRYLQNRSYIQYAENDYRYLPEKEGKRYVPGTFLNKWLGEDGFNICKGIRFDVPLGLGFTIKLEQDGYEELLSDMGHGITQIVSILLYIESALVENEVLSLKNARSNGGSVPRAIIAIEEPEVSLHPRYQSMLAQVLYDASTAYGQDIVFILESHSEYLIRKMQALVSQFSKEEFEKNPFAVYYFKPNGESYDLVFLPSGRFQNSFGPGFFDEASRSKYLLRISGK